MLKVEKNTVKVKTENKNRCPSRHAPGLSDGHLETGNILTMTCQQVHLQFCATVSSPPSLTVQQSTNHHDLRLKAAPTTITAIPSTANQSARYSRGEGTNHNPLNNI